LLRAAPNSSPRWKRRAFFGFFVNEQGTTAHAGTGSKTDAGRLEMFFAKHNIPIKIEKVR
jgi:hypothetical protein